MTKNGVGWADFAKKLVHQNLEDKSYSQKTLVRPPKPLII